MADLASIAAAVTAGYSETVLDRGASANPAVRYFVTLEKQLVGGRQSGVMYRAFGEASSQAAAETQALANLNGKRALRYNGANATGRGRWSTARFHARRASSHSGSPETTSLPSSCAGGFRSGVVMARSEPARNRAVEHVAEKVPARRLGRRL